MSTIHTQKLGGGQVYYLGTGTSFNIKSKLPNIDYTKLTVSNFIVGAINAPNTSTEIAYKDISQSMANSPGFSVSKSYNASTGVLTVGPANYSIRVIGPYWAGPFGYASLTLAVYLVVGDIISI